MTTFFLLVTGVCQSLNELGVVSITKKVVRPKPDQPDRLLRPSRLLVSHAQTLLEKSLVTLAAYPCAGRMQFDDV